MNANEWWANQAENIFEIAFQSEFFGNHLFETEERSYYPLTPQELNNPVAIMSDINKDETYKVLDPETISEMSHLRPVSFYCCVPIHRNWFEDNEQARIEKELKHKGILFAQKLNKVFINVLLASIKKDNTIDVQTENLDTVLASVVDALAPKGFRVNKFLFPETAKARLLQQGIIKSDNHIQIASYAGKTVTGQDAFFSNSLPKDTVLISLVFPIQE